MARRPDISALLLGQSGFSEMNALLASAVCHLAALIAMALVVAAGNAGISRIQLAVDISDSDEIASPADEFDAVAIEAAPEDAAAAAGPVRLFDDSLMAASDLAPLEALAEMAGHDSGAEGIALQGFGDGTGSGGEQGKAATDFFGIGGYGKSFVYVVDCSGSMGEDGKFQRAIYELLRSIEQLNSDQKYYVIFYSHKAFPMPGDGLVAATEKEFARTQNWVRFARPMGGTYPLDALLMALKMRPDAIYFLSDGLFDPRTGREVRMRNKRKASQIPIHTIAFMNRESEGLMRTIARNSGGKFRFVQ